MYIISTSPRAQVQGSGGPGATLSEERGLLGAPRDGERRPAKVLGKLVKTMG